MSDWCAKALRPEIASFGPREIEPEKSSQTVGQRQPIHLGVEGYDEGLKDALTRPFLPALGCEVAVHQREMNAPYVLSGGALVAIALVIGWAALAGRR